MSKKIDLYVDSQSEGSDLLKNFLENYNHKYNFIFQVFDAEEEKPYLTVKSNQVGFLRGKQKLICVDFTDSKLLRRFAITSTKDIFIKSVYSKNKKPETLCDMTAGFGTDALIASKFFKKVILSEKNPLVFLMLEDGIRRAKENPKAKIFAEKVTLLNGESHDILSGWMSSGKPKSPVLYFDFMFEDKKTLSTKPLELLKELTSQEILNTENQTVEMKDILDLAINLEPEQVVLKAKKIAEGIQPKKVFKGKVVNYYQFI